MKTMGGGAPGETRTPNPQIRSLVLYPIELRAPTRAGDVADGLPRDKGSGRELVQFAQNGLTHDIGADLRGAWCHDVGGAQAGREHVGAGTFDKSRILLHAERM